MRKVVPVPEIDPSIGSTRYLDRHIVLGVVGVAGSIVERTGALGIAIRLEGIGGS
jgi:hypothetical protein